MPPKKIDPQAQKKEFELFHQSDEWKKIVELQQQIKTLKGISQTSKDYDIDGKFQVLWDLFYELAQLMRVKPPFKKIEHEWIRSIYFGEKRKVDIKEKKYFLDGIECQFQPVDADSQHNLRQVMIKEVYNKINDMDRWDIENYAKTKVEIKKGFQQFFNLMKNHIKKSFKIIYEEKMMEVMKPLSDLLEINMKLVLFDLKYNTPEERFINDFKHKAIVDRYCNCLDKVIDILMNHHPHDSQPIKYKINPRNIFKKLAYQNLTKIQSFYLEPYRTSFQAMKQGLCALFATGVNFWKVPIQENRKFVEDLRKVIDWQLICQRFFGNQLVRAQINFTADTLSSVDKANHLAKKYLLKQDPNSSDVMVPRLVAFKTLLHMRTYKDKLAIIQQKEKERNKIMGTTMFSKKSKQQDEASVSSPTTTKHAFNKTELNASKIVANQPKVEAKSQFDQLKQQLGRYWIWENYSDDDFRDKQIEPAVQHLKEINKAIYQDIQDVIIRQGMLPKKDRQNEELKEAAQILKGMKTIDNSQKSENMRRPPQLWNFPPVVQQQHKFRSIADPKKCYIDGRIQKLDDMIIKIGDKLKNYNKDEWIQLTRRVIDFYEGKPDPNPLRKNTNVGQEDQDSAE